jgi:uncharacterized protein (DUF1697 family)
MTMHIALLRAVNVGGTAAVKMADLKVMAKEMGFDDVQTVLQSGNLVFRAGAGKDAALESRIAAELEKRFALKTTVIVRSASAWAKIVEANPFEAEAKADPSHLLVMPLNAAPAAGAEANLWAKIKGREEARVVGDAAYIVYPDGIGRSKLTIAVIERALGAVGTARNWNTVTKLAALVAD